MDEEGFAEKEKRVGKNSKGDDDRELVTHRRCGGDASRIRLLPWGFFNPCGNLGL